MNLYTAYLIRSDCLNDQRILELSKQCLCADNSREPIYAFIFMAPTQKAKLLNQLPFLEKWLVPRGSKGRNIPNFSFITHIMTVWDTEQTPCKVQSHAKPHSARSHLIPSHQLLITKKNLRKDGMQQRHSSIRRLIQLSP